MVIKCLFQFIHSDYHQKTVTKLTYGNKAAKRYDNNLLIKNFFNKN